MSPRSSFRFHFFVVACFVATSLLTSGVSAGVCYTNGAGGCLAIVYGSTYQNAAANCAELGGALAVIDSAQKNSAMSDFMYKMWESKMLPVTSHIVFTAGQRQKVGDCNSPFVWKSKSQTPVSYINWAAGNPHCNNGASCLKVDVDAHMQWQAGDCSSGAVGVCETSN